MSESPLDADPAGNIPTPEKSDLGARTSEREHTVSQRRRIGYSLGAISLLGFGCLTRSVFGHLENLPKLETPEQFYVYVVAHAVVTAALVWFLYQLLKAAERMLLPVHYIDQVLFNDPALLRALIGVQDTTAGLKEVAKLLGSPPKSKD